MQCSVMQCGAVQCSAVRCNEVQCRAVCVVQCSAVYASNARLFRASLSARKCANFFLSNIHDIIQFLSEIKIELIIQVGVGCNSKRACHIARKERSYHFLSHN